eukprot:2482673-Amphidinium_carterae.1
MMNSRCEVPRALLMPEYQRIMAQRSASTQPSEINDATKKLQLVLRHNSFVSYEGSQLKLCQNMRVRAEEIKCDRNASQSKAFQQEHG